MNLNIYIEDKLGQQVTHIAKQLGKSRNSIIRLALQEWLASHQNQEWPATILNFRGVNHFQAFESHRKKLKSPKKDPFA